MSQAPCGEGILLPGPRSVPSALAQSYCACNKIQTMFLTVTSNHDHDEDDYTDIDIMTIMRMTRMTMIKDEHTMIKTRVVVVDIN